MPVDVVISPSGRRVSVDIGTTLLEAIQMAGLPFPGDCGGKGKCGKCAVVSGRGLGSVSAREVEVLREHQQPRDVRLACMATVVGQATVTVPSRNGFGGDKGVSLRQQPPAVDARVKVLSLSIPPATSDDPRSLLERILDAASTQGVWRPMVEARLLHSLPSVSSATHVRAILVDGLLVAVDEKLDAGLYGLAIDVGTTTIVVYLMDLATGSCLGIQSMENPQTAFGGDVLSRISAARHDEAKRHELHRVLIAGVDRLLDTLLTATGVAREDIWDAVIAGNTTMMHFFLGLSPASLAVTPYNSVTDDATENKATDIGLSLADEGRVRTLPGCKSFVGADTVSAVLASGMQKSRRPQLLIDIGTNGEIVLGSSEQLLAASTAAGPAFEGANIEFGLRAVTGAIDRVTVVDDLVFRTIDDAEPIGICGSGVIDAVYACRVAGLIEPNGNIVGSHSSQLLEERIIKWSRGRAIVLARSEVVHRQIVLTQEDVRQVQLAKGAMRAGIELLLGELGLGPADLDEIVLAGAFGSYIRPESAMGIGLVPPVPLERVRAIGNAAGRGAQMALVSKTVYCESLSLAKHLRYIPLSSQATFHRRFVAGMTFPDLPLVPATRVIG